MKHTQYPDASGAPGRPPILAGGAHAEFFTVFDINSIPPFEPIRWLRGGHAQTIAGAYWPLNLAVSRTTRHVVRLSDGDALMVHDDRPHGWQDGDRIAVLVHGLAGSHGSPYMSRLAGKLFARGIRAVRVDLRGAGAGMPLARLPYHSGRSDDIRAVIEFLGRESPESPVTVVGFSLGGNIVLKLLGELGPSECGRLDSGMAVCPPIDLQAGSQQLSRWANRLYDVHFVRLLDRQLRLRLRLRPDAATTTFSRRPRRLREFDDVFTAPLAGFRSVDEYYEQCSAGPLLTRIARPTWIVAAADDPIVPAAPLERIATSASLRLTITRHGGHLGFLARRGVDLDRHWIDWRIIDWVTSLPPVSRDARAERGVTLRTRIAANPIMET